ncbi:hypothetical protein THAOC_34212 [Thalassiosira oceanica]|uniref:Uncharacterized protein n=1 Tax=Thalassiosira oceanica TaxID=159749 RepID=K0R5H5_THAOC|nr:hypothetical protein THAOC_34212 [Thalassiosira oceanica]|eukprot:EJK47094.1 hypothetical protein THAOC_34212 [Thalassiosira oceanica]
MGRRQKAESRLKKNLLALHNSLPESLLRIWVTAEELRLRLIVGGVDESLKIEHIRDALRRHNTDFIFLTSRVYADVIYYRPTLIHEKDPKDLPNGQRFKNKATGVQNRVNVSPDRDCLRISDAVKLQQVNEILVDLAADDLARRQGMFRARVLSILCHLTPFQAEEKTPAETHEIGVQAEPQPACEPTRVGESYDGNCIMSVSMMEEFIEMSNKHSVLCGAAPTLVKRCNKQGAAMNTGDDA